MEETEKRILFALDWIKQIRKPILDVFYSLEGFDLKANNTEVTAADRNTEAEFRKIVTSKFPTDGIIGEEFSEQNKEGDYTWTIDPIDGTRAFARGVPFFGTMLSFYRNNSILFGVIAYHALGETIYAIKDKGCYWKADYMNDFEIAQVSPTDKIAEAVLCFSGNEYFQKAEQETFISNLQSRVQFWRTWGDCYGYCLLARGKIDIMCDPLLNKWDLVPIKIIVEEAGGLFVDFDGSDTTVDSTNVICANPKLIPQIITKKVL